MLCILGVGSPDFDSSSGSRRSTLRATSAGLTLLEKYYQLSIKCNPSYKYRDDSIFSSIVMQCFVHFNVDIFAFSVMSIPARVHPISYPIGARDNFPSCKEAGA